MISKIFFRLDTLPPLAGRVPKSEYSLNEPLAVLLLIWNSPLSITSHNSTSQQGSKSSWDHDVNNSRPRLTTSLNIRSRPPPRPTVEDEDVSAAREYGTPSPTHPVGETPQSRGDIEQYPILLEVHEHNPERRYVIVDKSSPQAVEADDHARNTLKDEVAEDGVAGDYTKQKTYTQPKSEAQPDLDLHRERPTLERRRSRQELPPIDTICDEPRGPQHHRTRSGASLHTVESETPRKTHNFGDHLLSPEIINSGTSRREINRQELGQTTSASDSSNSRRSHSVLADERRRQDAHQRRSPSPAPGKRSSSHMASTKHRRQDSTDRDRDARYGVGQPAVSGTRDRQSTNTRVDPRVVKPTPGRRSRESSCSGDERLTSLPPQGTRRSKPTIVHCDDRSPTRDEDGSTKATRDPRLRGATVSAQPPSSARLETGIYPRASATFPAGLDERRSKIIPETQVQPQIFYHEGDRPREGSSALPMGGMERAETMRARPVPSGPRPDPSHSSVRTDRLSTSTTAMPDPTTRVMGQDSSRNWHVPPFDPEKDGVRPERPVGSYRRFSDGQDLHGPSELPDCPRKTPVAGKMDWLTLPRTDFNICAKCYDSVFSDSKHRAEFQPMLRPSDRPIACDFGSSPWYRIAWLMTWHRQIPDLRLFYQIATLLTSPKIQSCPGNKRCTRTWYTIKDPYTRRPIPDFSVCCECAKTVEILLPNLGGVFTTLDHRAEPSRDTCELHFTPERKRFVLYFDILERTSDVGLINNQKPNIEDMARQLDKLSSASECREDSPIPEAYWHMMQFLPEFTVCGDCFDDVVRPRLEDRNIIALNFLKTQKKLPLAACQLYSRRMREIFSKTCRKNDPAYLEEKVRERLEIEAGIQARLAKLDRGGQDDDWAEEQVSKLIQEWKRWE